MIYLSKGGGGGGGADSDHTWIYPWEYAAWADADSEIVPISDLQFSVNPQK